MDANIKLCIKRKKNILQFPVMYMNLNLVYQEKMQFPTLSVHTISLVHNEIM